MILITTFVVTVGRQTWALPRKDLLVRKIALRKFELQKSKQKQT
jgi:hypothetical protein